MRVAPYGQRVAEHHGFCRVRRQGFYAVYGAFRTFADESLRSRNAEFAAAWCNSLTLAALELFAALGRLLFQSRVGKRGISFIDKCPMTVFIGKTAPNAVESIARARLRSALGEGTSAKVRNYGRGARHRIGKA